MAKQFKFKYICASCTGAAKYSDKPEFKGKSLTCQFCNMTNQYQPENWVEIPYAEESVPVAVVDTDGPKKK